MSNSFNKRVLILEMLLILALIRKLYGVSVSFSDIQTLDLTCTVQGSNCVACTSEGSCTHCQLGYFLYSASVSFDPQNGGLQSSKNYCVQCPYYQMPLQNFIQCGDCLDNPNTWQNSRTCSYSYGMKDNSKTYYNIYSKLPSPVKKLFFIKNVQNSYQIQECVGCQQFCGNQTSLNGCNKSTIPSQEILQTAFTCQQGYYFQQNQCKICSANLSCSKCQNSSKCTQCASGYALNKLSSCDSCQQAIPNCSSCFYGDSSGNDYSDNPSQYTVNPNVVLSLRCKVCTVYQQQTLGGQTITIPDITQMAIPSLDMTQCLQCSVLISNCIKCDYAKNQSQYIHSEQPQVITSSQQGNYSLRCRRCIDGYYVNPSFTCSPFDPIAHANCMVPVQGDYTSSNQSIKYPTLNVQIQGNQVLFIDQSILQQPYPASYVKYCAICVPGFKGSTQKPYVCSVPVPPTDNCQNYSNLNCIACKQGSYLNAQKQCVTINPQSPPTQKFSNINNCGSFYYDGSQYNCLTCQPGSTGQYPDYQQRSCQNCDQNCFLCTEFNTRFFFDDVKMLLFPQISEDQQQFYKQTFKLQPTLWCKTCGGSGKINPLTGKCNSCSQTSCQISPTTCLFDQFGAFCLNSALTAQTNYRGNTRSTSQSADRTGTVYCSDYQNSCLSISDTDKIAKNPFLSQNSNYIGTVLWTMANQCQNVNNVVFNSQLQKCLICNSAGVACRKKVVIQTFFDTVATTSTMSDTVLWSQYSSNLGSLPNNIVFNSQVYLLSQINTEGNSKVINLGSVLSSMFDGVSLNYLKYADEGVDEIQFQFIIVSTISTNPNLLNAVSLGFQLAITQNAFQMIPSLNKVTLTLTTMKQGVYSSIGVYTLPLYLSSIIQIDSFSNVSINNINLSPTSDLNQFQSINIFGISLTNTLLPITVQFNNCQITTQQTIQQQQTNFISSGISSYFLLTTPNLQELDLNNFTLNQFYYPTGINWYFPGNQNNAINFNFQNSNFFDLSFSYVNIFAANNTNTQFNFNQVYLKQLSLTSSNFVSESSNLTSSNIMLNLQQITFENINLIDSFLINVLNAIRFQAQIWTIKTPFYMTSSQEITAAFQTNLINLNNFQVVTVTDNTQNPPQPFKLVLNKASLFKTPPYSLNVLYNQQINHIYSNIVVDGVYCNLSQKTDQIQVSDCIFSLSAPYNNYDYLLNVQFQDITIQNIKSSNNFNTESHSYLVSIKQVNSVSISNLKLFSNFNFDGITIYNPSNLVINNFVCGEVSSNNFSTALSWIDNFSLNNIISTQIVQGFCMNLSYCQESIVLKKLYLQNYIGLDQSPFYINCPSEIKLNSQTYSPVNIQDFTITNSIILLTDPNIQVAPIQFISNFQFQIQISNIQINGSYLIPLNSIITMTFSSASGIYLDSVSSTILVDYSTFQSTISYKTQNSVYIQSQSVTIQNSLFQNSNVADSNQFSQSSGGALYLSASSIKIINCNFKTIYANQGGAIFLNGLQQTNAIIQNSVFSHVYTPYLSQSDGQGGAIYADARSSQFNLLIDTCTFAGVFARTMGGIVYMESGSRITSLTIQSSTLSNIYAPQGSLLFWSTTNSASSIVLNNNQFIWDDQGLIDQQIAGIYTNYQSVKDSLLEQAWQQHSFIFMKKGTLTMNQNIFFGIKYQSLMILSQINQFSDNSSQINGFLMVSYPLIYFDTPQISVQFTSTTITGIQVCPQQLCNPNKSHFISLFKNTANALILTENSVAAITYTNLVFTNNILLTNTGLLSFILPTGTLKIIGGIFTNNYSTFGVIYIEKQSYVSSNTRVLSAISNPTVQIIGASFSFNKGVNGTAINSLNSDLKIQSCTFSNNLAQNFGGAIYFYGDTNDQSSQLMFYGATFTNNIARIGGAYQMQGVPAYFDPSSNIVSTNNQALIYGTNNADYPRSIQLIYNGCILKYKDSTQTPVITIKNYGSGQNPGSFVIQLLGSDGKIFYAENTYCTVSLNYNGQSIPNTAQLIGSTRVQFSNIVKGFNITGINFIIQPPNSLNVKISCDAIKNPSQNANSNSYDTTYFFPLIISMRDCAVGEVYQSSSGQCYACPAGKYSLVQGADSCLACPKIGVDKCEGYNNMVISAGYWRKNTSSDIIIQCNNLESNCLGGSTSKMCYEGHIGALCEECDIDGKVWGERYSHSSDFTCGKCSQISDNVIKIVAISLWTIISIYLSASSSIQLVQHNTMRNIFILLGTISAGKSTEKSNLTSVLIKILTSYFQIISVLFTFKLNTPATLSNITNTVGNPSKQMGMSINCFLVDFSGNIPITYFSLLWMLVNPLLYLGLALVFFLFYSFYLIIIKKLQEVKKNLSYIWCTFIFLFITFQPSIVSAYIATSSCRTIGDTEYVKANVSLEYYTPEHINYLIKLILPILLIWVFVIPMLFFTKLYVNRDQIYYKSSLKYAFGYLYQEYQPKAYLWEFVKMFEKVMIIIFVNIYESDVKVKGVLSFMCIIIYLILSYTFKPYHDIQLNRLDQLANEICALSIIIGVFINNNNFGYLVYLGYFFLGFFNIYFLLIILRNLFKGFASIIDKLFYNNFDKIVKKLSCFPKIQHFLQGKIKKYVSTQRVQQLWRVINKRYKLWVQARKKNSQAKFLDIQNTPDNKKIAKQISDEQSYNSIFSVERFKQKYDSPTPLLTSITNLKGNIKVQPLQIMISQNKQGKMSKQNSFLDIQDDFNLENELDKNQSIKSDQKNQQNNLIIENVPNQQQIE
ncbi:transmembrane protein, putative (macronuclear) [Tetrahymena thermophila SB210]|uniref:Transmembrane protein, putative n=1 Tax=Tetrahymena thermophila (strain SB210) TaxID=312017 RepID=I7MMA9_TETTS|nr:transmembrane protein, putative [Tetrahymena thermophila SB210]EAS04487.2 transmembrane protein, putative [Tetrahymena thermophila SB210]|eukprot:XP_001024732.2 transmembrane protein, putative [Tetrahymena thermophila SB210]